MKSRWQRLFNHMCESMKAGKLQTKLMISESHKTTEIAYRDHRSLLLSSLPFKDICHGENSTEIRI